MKLASISPQYVKINNAFNITETQYKNKFHVLITQASKERYSTLLLLTQLSLFNIPLVTLPGQ